MHGHGRRNESSKTQNPDTKVGPANSRMLLGPRPFRHPTPSISENTEGVLKAPRLMVCSTQMRWKLLEQAMSPPAFHSILPGLIAMQVRIQRSKYRVQYLAGDLGSLRTWKVLPDIQRIGADLRCIRLSVWTIGRSTSWSYIGSWSPYASNTSGFSKYGTVSTEPLIPRMSTLKHLRWLKNERYPGLASNRRAPEDAVSTSVSLSVDTIATILSS